VVETSGRIALGNLETAEAASSTSRLGRRMHLLRRVFADKVAAKPVDGCVNDAIVSPPKQGIRDPRGHPHGSLHHFDRPVRMSPCLSVVAVEGEPRYAFQIAMHERGDAPFGDAFVEDDVEAHAIREWGYDNPVEHGSVFEASSFDREVAQPAPPRRESIDLGHPRPKLGNGNRKCERAVVVDDIWGARHAPHPTYEPNRTEPSGRATFVDAYAFTGVEDDPSSVRFRSGPPMPFGVPRASGDGCRRQTNRRSRMGLGYFVRVFAREPLDSGVGAELASRSSSTVLHSASTLRSSEANRSSATAGDRPDVVRHSSSAMAGQRLRPT
jgi:hypothetical protein